MQEQSRGKSQSLQIFALQGTGKTKNISQLTVVDTAAQKEACQVAWPPILCRLDFELRPGDLEVLHQPLIVRMRCQTRAAVSRCERVAETEDAELVGFGHGCLGQVRFTIDGVGSCWWTLMIFDKRYG